MQIRSLSCYGGYIYMDAFSCESANKSFNMYGLTCLLHADDEDDKENAYLGKTVEGGSIWKSTIGKQNLL